jgi:hypothetical protein
LATLLFRLGGTKGCKQQQQQQEQEEQEQEVSSGASQRQPNEKKQVFCRLTYQPSSKSALATFGHIMRLPTILIF